MKGNSDITSMIFEKISENIKYDLCLVDVLMTWNWDLNNYIKYIYSYC